MIPSISLAVLRHCYLRFPCPICRLNNKAVNSAALINTFQAAKLIDTDFLQYNNWKSGMQSLNVALKVSFTPRTVESPTLVHTQGSESCQQLQTTADFKRHNILLGTRAH